jgi:pimeloyl-ACP methyl ester carboxylesterase
MDWWRTEFCERLAVGARFVIRYDHRDTGQSVSYEPGAPSYSGSDLVEDAVGVLDALDVPAAHVVGMSMGGALAQLVALDHPGHVSSLTLISTTSVGEGDADLPPMTAELRAAYEQAVEPDWSDRAAVLDYLTAFSRAHASRSASFDEDDERALWRRVLDRTVSIESTVKNHALLDSESGPRQLRRLDVPTLVIHGTEDPLFPHEHGVALAREIPGARLLTLEHTGHELPRRVWDDVVPAILELTTSRR